MGTLSTISANLVSALCFLFQVKSDLIVVMKANDSRHPSRVVVIPIIETNQKSHLDPEITYSFGNVYKDDTRFKLTPSREGMLCTYSSYDHTICGIPVRVAICTKSTDILQNLKIAKKGKRLMHNMNLR